MDLPGSIRVGALPPGASPTLGDCPGYAGAALDVRRTFNFW
jgi:hypothetical protein